MGATILLKDILYNYLSIKYDLSESKPTIPENHTFSSDEYLKNVNRTLIAHEEKKKAFLIQDKSNYLKNKTYHYILDLKAVKEVSKAMHVSISEYLATIYSYSLYESIYDKKSKKDIVLNIPVDLRKYYNVQSFSNFFTCMNINCNVDKSTKVSFRYILKNIHDDFQIKLTPKKLDSYLSRDVAMGTNLAVSVIPLFIKKLFMKYLGRLVSQSTTTTFSNLGIIELEEPYNKYVENIFTIVNSGKFQKIKCTVCTYKNQLNVTINSNLLTNKFEQKFYELLVKYCGEVKLEGTPLRK